MSTTIADLRVSFRAEGVEEIGKNARQAKEQVAALGAEARATGSELDALAKKFSSSQGGSASQWRGILETQHLTSAKVQEALGGAATSAQRLSTAAQQTVAPTQAAARAVSDLHVGLGNSATAALAAASGGAELHKHFELSGATVLRVVGAITGVNLGLNIAAGAARALHGELVAAADAAIAVDRISRGLSSAYGAGAAGAQSFSESLGPQAGVTPSTVAQALTAARPLSTTFGLGTGQVQQLTTRAADLAGQSGQPFDETFSKVLDAVRNGGTQLEGYGIRLDDVAMKTTAWNGALAGTWTNMTQAQQVGARFTQFLEQSAASQGQAATAATTLSGAWDRLGTSSQRLLQTIGAGVQQPLTGGAQGLSGALNAAASLLTVHPDTQGPSGLQDRRLVRDASGGFVLSGAPDAVKAGTADLLAGFAGLPGPAAAVRSPSTLTGPRAPSAVDLFNLDQQQSAAAARLAASQGGVIDIGRAGAGQLGDIASRRAEVALLQSQVAQRERGGGLESQLGVALGQATGDSERGRLTEQLLQLREYKSVLGDIVQAEHDQVTAQRAITEAQEKLTVVAIRQRERETEVATRTLDVRRQDIQAQQTVQLLAVTTNRAQLGAMPAQGALADLQYKDQRVALQAQARTSRLLQGKDVSDLPDMDTLIREHVQNQLDQPETALTALDATHTADVAGRAQTAAQLREQITGAPLGAARLALDAANLGDVPGVAQATGELSAAQLAQINADRAARAGSDRLAGMAGQGRVVVNAPITINIGDQQDREGIIEEATARFAESLRAALDESSNAGEPADRMLAGARR